MVRDFCAPFSEDHGGTLICWVWLSAFTWTDTARQDHHSCFGCAGEKWAPKAGGVGVRYSYEHALVSLHLQQLVLCFSNNETKNDTTSNAKTKVLELEITWFDTSFTEWTNLSSWRTLKNRTRKPYQYSLMQKGHQESPHEKGTKSTKLLQQVPPPSFKIKRSATSSPGSKIPGSFNFSIPYQNVCLVLGRQLGYGWKIGCLLLPCCLFITLCKT